MAVRTRTEARKHQRRILPPDRARRANPVQGIALDGRRLDMQVGDRLIDAILERNITQGDIVTLTLWNKDRAVLTSGVLGRRVMNGDARIELDGLGYIAAGTSKHGDTLEIPFEDEVVVFLKRHGKDKPLRRSRSADMTRIHFCATMIRQAGIPVLVLDENAPLPVAGQKKLGDEVAKAKGQTVNNAGKSRTAKKGIAGDLTIKKASATSEQRRNVATGLGVAAELKASDLATLAMLVAGIAEGQWVTARKNPTSTATGPFQILASTAQNIRISQTDVAAGARRFLQHGFGGNTKGAIRLAREQPTLTPGDIANICEGGGAGASFYNEWRTEAERWLKAVRGGSFTFNTTTTRPLAYERKKGESTWASAKRLLDEVNVRLFVREGVAVIATDPALMRARPALEINEHSDAFENLDFDWHRALRVGEMTVQAYVGRWQADPGEVATVKDLPQDHGNWLLATVRESLLNVRPLAELTLQAPVKPKAETADETTTTATTIEAGDLYTACAAIDKQNLPYVWGGGHAKAGTPDRGTGRDPGVGYDCSGAVGAALAAAGLGLRPGQSVPGSGWFASSWGQPGQGKHMTVWANDGHVFIELNFAGHAGKSFDTRRIGDSRSGPHIRAALGPTGGFTPRHWPGS